jgi:hypothetical protein
MEQLGLVVLKGKTSSREQIEYETIPAFEEGTVQLNAR